MIFLYPGKALYLIGNSVVYSKFVELQHEMFSVDKIRELQHLSDTSGGIDLLTVQTYEHLFLHNANFEANCRM